MKVVDARRFAKILRLRGCQIARQKGGHTIWKTPDGSTITAVSEGRPTGVKSSAIVNAAHALGISPQELLATRKKVRS